MAKKTSKVLVLKGCETCDLLKSNGLCKTEKCVDVNSKLGQKLVKESGADSVPQRVCKTETGKFMKCDTTSILKKFSKKRK